MDTSAIYPGDTRDVFARCGTCSRTFFFLLNREFGHLKEKEEIAADPLAGGLLNRGNQCGMLWGCALALGAESFRRYGGSGKATALAIMATRRVMESFLGRTKTVNCRDITGCDLTGFSGMTKLMLKSFRHGMKNSPCFILAEQWAPEAIQAAFEGVSAEPAGQPEMTLSCASEVVKRMGGTEEEMTTAAGFAGGLGLGGHGCGALAAAAWMRSLAWCREHPGKKLPYFNNPVKKPVLKAFYGVTGSRILCSEISGKVFKTTEEHTEFIRNGGCEELIRAVSRPV